MTSAFSSLPPSHPPYAARFIFLTYSPDSASSWFKPLQLPLPAGGRPTLHFGIQDPLGSGSGANSAPDLPLPFSVHHALSNEQIAFSYTSSYFSQDFFLLLASLI